MNYCHTNQPVNDAAEHVAASILTHLRQEQSVLWLLSGGSGAQVVLRAATLLQGEDLTRLRVSMTDERYGPVGHADENWQQLLDAGLSLPGAELYRPLCGEDLPTTTARFDEWLTEALARSDYRIGIFGMGTDGHTAGIKPHAHAVDMSGLAGNLHAEDFQRLTITFTTISSLDEAVLQVAGDAKRAVLRQLFTPDQSLDDMPASILHTVPSATLYTDLPKEEIT